MSLSIVDIMSAFSSAKVTYTEQAGYHKFAQDRKAIYVKKTKTGRVNQIHISAFNVQHDAVSPPPRKNGLVTGHVNMRHDDAIDAIDMAITALVDGKPGSKWFDQEDVTRSN